MRPIYERYDLDESSDPDLFLRSPLRTGVFFGGAGLLALILVVAVLILLRGGARLPDLGLVMLALGVFHMGFAWYRALRCHDQIRELFERGQLESAWPGSPQGRVLDVFSAMFKTVLPSAILGGAYLLIAGALMHGH